MCRNSRKCVLKEKLFWINNSGFLDLKRRERSELVSQYWLSAHLGRTDLWKCLWPIEDLKSSSLFYFFPAVSRVLRRGAEVKIRMAPKRGRSCSTSVNQPAKNGTHARELQCTLHLPFECSSHLSDSQSHLPSLQDFDFITDVGSCVMSTLAADDGEVTGYERARNAQGKS